MWLWLAIAVLGGLALIQLFNLVIVYDRIVLMSRTFDEKLKDQDQAFTGHFAELASISAEADDALKDRIMALEARLCQLEGRSRPSRDTSADLRRGWDADPDLDSGNDALDRVGRN